MELLTLWVAVERREENNEDCRRVLAGVDKVWETQARVEVKPHALVEAKPRRKASGNPSEGTATRVWHDTWFG